MESECIGSYAKAHPQTRFINVSQGGIGIPGIPNMALSEASDRELKVSLDLQALMHAEIQHLKMPPLQEKIDNTMKSIGESLLRLRSIAEEMVEELEKVRSLCGLGSCFFPTGKMTILEMDFQEEKAFECLFPTLGEAIDKLLFRSFFLPPDSSEEEKRSLLIESKIAKWKHWKQIINSEIAAFQHYIVLPVETYLKALN
jgi:hypothetical protein